MCSIERFNSFVLFAITRVVIDIDDGGWDGVGIVPRLEMAIRDINARDDVLPGYRLHWKLLDSKVTKSTICCVSTVKMSIFM